MSGAGGAGGRAPRLRGEPRMGRRAPRAARTPCTKQVKHQQKLFITPERDCVLAHIYFLNFFNPSHVISSPFPCCPQTYPPSRTTPPLRTLRPRTPLPRAPPLAYHDTALLRPSEAHQMTCGSTRMREKGLRDRPPRRSPPAARVSCRAYLWGLNYSVLLVY